MLKRLLSFFLVVIMAAMLPDAAIAVVKPVYADKPSAALAKEVDKAISLNLVPKDMQSKFTNTITRQEFCRLIVSLCKAWNMSAEDIAKKRKLDINKFTLNDTKDINVRLCVMLGIAEVKSKGVFKPDSVVIRQEAAKMLYETANQITLLIVDEMSHKSSLPSAYPHIFGDGNLLQNGSRDAVFWVYHKGIMSSLPNNLFNPNGSCTREQAYAAVLHLFYANGSDSLNIKPEPEYYPYNGGYIDQYGNTYTKEQKGYVYPFNKKYDVVIDNVGVGCGACHIVDSKGKTMMTSLGNKGEFNNVILYENIAQVFAYDGLEKGDQGCYVVNLDTGKVYRNSVLGNQSDGMQTIAIDFKNYGYLNEKGEMAVKTQYKSAGDFYNGRAIVQQQNGTYMVIDKRGKILKKLSLNLKKYTVMQMQGEYAQVKDSKQKNAVYQADKGFLTGFLYDNLSFCSNGQFIAGKSGRYTLLNQNGKPISKTYPNALIQADKNRYLGWVSYKNREYVLVDEKGKELQTVNFGPCVQLLSDGGGLYLYHKDDKHCVVLDNQGHKLCTIASKNMIFDLRFVNGLIYLSDGSAHPTYYLPNGTPVF